MFRRDKTLQSWINKLEKLSKKESCVGLRGYNTTILHVSSARNTKEDKVENRPEEDLSSSCCERKRCLHAEIVSTWKKVTKEKAEKKNCKTVINTGVTESITCLKGRNFWATFHFRPDYFNPWASRGMNGTASNLTTKEEEYVTPGLFSVMI